MSSYSYEAVDAGGLKTQGILDVADQSEALRRIKEMGLFPTKIAESRRRPRRANPALSLSAPESAFSLRGLLTLSLSLPGGRVRSRTLAVFTRQLATLVEAGMPLLRGLRTLQEQQESPALKRILGEVAASIEGGSTLSEALAAYPRNFTPLYLNMVKAGELSGALDTTLRRLAEFMEKAQRIKGKIKAAMFYPGAVLSLALAILSALMVFVVPKFRAVFENLLHGADLPGLTLFILKVSEVVKTHIFVFGLAVFGLGAVIAAGVRTRLGRRIVDWCKLSAPLIGPVFRKLAVSRFTRTLGTLLNSGVPVLQALTIVRDTVGNVIVARLISKIHDSVKEGETIAAPLKASRVFPVMVAGMVDVGEQTGSLPDMLMKIADGYDEEVDNAISAMTSLLEPIMLVLLAFVVGGIVIALFLPLLKIMEIGFEGERYE